MKERDGNRIDPFINEYCSFIPFSWTEDNGKLKPIVFKVVTQDLESLGLRKNPNIMRFEIGVWNCLSDNKVNIGNSDWGGIWSAVKFSGAKTLSKYMEEKHNVPTRTFLTIIDNPVYANSYRVKSQGICLLEEVFTRTNLFFRCDSRCGSGRDSG